LEKSWPPIFLFDLKKVVSQIRELKVYVQSIGEASLSVKAINFFQISCHCIVLHAGGQMIFIQSLSLF